MMALWGLSMTIVYMSHHEINVGSGERPIQRFGAVTEEMLEEISGT